MLRFLSACGCILALASASIFAQPANPKDDPSRIGARDVGKGVNLYSMEKEIALGRQLAQEVQRQTKVVDDPLIAEYVNRMGQNLVRNSDAKVPFTFQVIEGESPNAFAFPGGYVFVFTGLIKIADEEDELAAAMAHEIAHVAARHMTREATKSQLATLATLPIAVLLGGGFGGYAIHQAANFVMPVAFLRFSRQDEVEADYLGVQYLYSAGYDPNGAVSIFEKIESLGRKRPTAVSRILSTHPMDAARIQKTEREIAQILPARPDYIVTTSDYDAIRQRVIALDAHKPAPPKQPTLRRSTDPN
jgi:predicted Zn-dependent protease